MGPTFRRPIRPGIPARRPGRSNRSSGASPCHQGRSPEAADLVCSCRDIADEVGVHPARPVDPDGRTITGCDRIAREPEMAEAGAEACDDHSSPPAAIWMTSPSLTGRSRPRSIRTGGRRPDRDGHVAGGVGVGVRGGREKTDEGQGGDGRRTERNRGSAETSPFSMP